MLDDLMDLHDPGMVQPSERVRFRGARAESVSSLGLNRFSATRRLRLNCRAE